MASLLPSSELSIPQPNSGLSSRQESYHSAQFAVYIRFAVVARQMVDWNERLQADVDIVL